jgi:hypothetical protein
VSRDRYSGSCVSARVPPHRGLGGGRVSLSPAVDKSGDFGYDMSDTSSSVGGSSVQSAASSALQSSMDSLTKLMAERFDQSATQVKAVSDRLTPVESKHGEMASFIS